MGTLTAAEQSVIDELIRRGAMLQDYSLSELAADCHVAKSTVSKTIKKLGFKGFSDFIYTYKLSSNIQRDRLLPQQAIEGDSAKVEHDLAALFKENEGNKNIICSLGSFQLQPLMRYISRKLAMFDIFAPASYDYSLYEHVHLDPGFVFMFPRKSAPVDPTADLRPIWKTQADKLHSMGYTVVTLSDDAELQNQIDSGYAVTIRSSHVHGTDADLFIPNVLMLFEDTLSVYAHETHSRPASNARS